MYSKSVLKDVQVLKSDARCFEHLFDNLNFIIYMIKI